jgi:hypothetical protein
MANTSTIVRSKIPGKEHLFVEYKTIRLETEKDYDAADRMHTSGKWQINQSGMFSIQFYRLIDKRGKRQ